MNATISAWHILTYRDILTYRATRIEIPRDPNKQGPGVNDLHPSFSPVMRLQEEISTGRWVLPASRCNLPRAYPALDLDLISVDHYSLALAESISRINRYLAVELLDVVLMTWVKMAA
jgi:hypothetical protein